jgi:hypothetical protein
MSKKCLRGNFWERPEPQKLHFLHYFYALVSSEYKFDKIFVFGFFFVYLEFFLSGGLFSIIDENYVIFIF